MITPPGLPAGCPPWFAHPAARDWTCTPAPAGVQAFHAGLPGYTPTPLAEVPALAAELGVGRVFVKDESARMGLPAFKVLGASWAVYQVLSRRPAGDALTLVTATDGNHGRAVARMARLFGQGAHVFVPGGVHPTAVAAIAAEGAQVTEIAGTYDEAVLLAAEAAGKPGTALVQDAGWPGYEQVPGWIVEGYSTLFAEVDAQLSQAGVAQPALVVIPAGVGSLAQAGVIHYRGRPDSRMTALLTVEPGTAACVLASLIRGGLGTISTRETIMAGLNCGTPSMLAWPYLRDGLDAAVAVADADSATAARDLAGHGIPAGPCGGAALAGARAALAGEGAAARRASLAIRPDATVVLLSTEGSAANPVPLSLIAPIRDLRYPGQAGAVEVAFGRARSRHAGDRTGVEGLAAVRAHRHGRDDVPARGMPHLDGRPAGRRPPVTPLPHGRDHVPEIAALAGEPVFRTRRVIGVSHPLQDFAVDQVVQPLGKDVAGDPQPGLEVIEAGHAEEGVPDDEQTPPFPHDVEALGDRAVHVLKAGPLHEHKHRGLRNRTHSP
jgi:diaminopropionate ammonia-lyase